MAWVSKRKASDGSARYLANYRDPTGAKRSAGTFRSRPDAERAGHAAEIRIGEGAWVDRTAGKIWFTDYVEKSWWPHLAHLELTTKAAYRSNLDAHFLPFFGRYPMAAINPPVVQDWVATAQRGGLSAWSIRKYHTMLSSIFKAAHRDRVIGYNPCERTTLPKVVTTTRETITPVQFEKLLAAIPERHRVLLLVGIETGMRWGELAALRPRHLDSTGNLLTVQKTIAEISKKNSPTGQRYTVKPYPKNDHRRTLKVGSELTGCSSIASPCSGYRTMICCSPPPRGACSSRPRGTPFAPKYGDPPCRQPDSPPRFGCTISDTRTPHGSLLAAPIEDRHGPARPRPDRHHPALPPRPRQRRRHRPKSLQADARPAPQRPGTSA